MNSLLCIVLANLQQAAIYRQCEVRVASLINTRPTETLSEAISCMPEKEAAIAASILSSIFKSMSRGEIMGMIDDESYIFINDAYPKILIKEGVRSSCSRKLAREQAKEEFKAKLKSFFK